MSQRLVQIRAPYFTAGIIFYKDRVKVAAPILNWSVGKSYDYMRNVCRKKNWKFINISKED
uniref:Uncharacterized protein n=1 Tax=viral metagenome TaxID=1070528 RepID=A0A6M3KYY3_9ZZZZ